MGLRFPSEQIPGVRDGNITMQFGLWKRPRVVAGRVYVVKGLGIVRVTAVEKVDLTRLTPWEAAAAGAEDVTELMSWLKEEDPDADLTSRTGYRVRFRYLGPETGTGEGEEAEEAVVEEKTGGETASPVPPTAIPHDLMNWVGKRPWRDEHLRLLASGIWRNADDLSEELEVDSATTRRRMGDLRKRGLVTSHRHHGYRITPEGQGALSGMVDESAEAAGTSAADWLRGREGRSDVLELLKDGRWHNAAEIGEHLDISVVSVQRRVAALRDRGLVESHRRRGYRLTDVGFEALGLVPTDATAPPPTPSPEVPTPVDTAPTADRQDVPAFKAPTVEPIPSDLLEWLEAKQYRKDLLMAISPDEYVATSELSEILDTTVTALHGRLATFKKRDLVEAMPRKGYKLASLGTRSVEVLKAIAMKRREEPAGASAFLSAEPEGWTEGAVPTAVTTAPPPKRRRRTSGETCGFCQASERDQPHPDWVKTLQTHLEAPNGESTKVKPIPCQRGVFEDSAWFLVLDRNPLAEGHCKLICKEHIDDMLELAEWSQRDQRLAHVRDSMARDLLLAVEVVASLDDRIVDVMVVSGLEQQAHLHFDLIPKYRMDLPGMRPLASSKAYYDDLSLSKKRKLWKSRREHLEEVAGNLRDSARHVLATKGGPGLRVSGP